MTKTNFYSKNFVRKHTILYICSLCRATYAESDEIRFFLFDDFSVIYYDFSKI